MSGLATVATAHEVRSFRLYNLIHNHYWHVRHLQSIIPLSYDKKLNFTTLRFPSGPCNFWVFTSHAIATCTLELGLGYVSLFVWWAAFQSVAVDLQFGFPSYTIANLTYSLSSHLDSTKVVVTATFVLLVWLNCLGVPAMCFPCPVTLIE